MKNRKRLLKTIIEFFVFTLIMGFIVTKLMDTTYAVMSPGSPDVVVTINENGQISQQGNLFGDDLWYPDQKGRDGVIRIYNNYKSTKLTNLGVTVDLNSFRDGYMETEVYQSFIDHMRLTIKKGSWLVFGETSIIYDKPIAEFINGIILEQNDQLSITASNPIDLKYTMRMDEEAGNELQSLSADVSFIIKISLGDQSDNNPPDEDNEPDDPTDNNPPVIPPTVEVTTPLVEEPVTKIPDIDGHWAHDCIITLLEKKIIQGDEKGRINPDKYITRAEASVLVSKALNLQPKDQTLIKYRDVIPQWAQGYVNISSKENIFTGYPNGQFKPQNNITREEMIAVLTRAFKLKLDDDSLLLPFEDKNKIGVWALNNVKSGYEDKVITGYPDNTYRPKDKITRAEAFTIICKLLKYHDTHLHRT